MKYTRWADGLSDTHLLCVLCAIGEIERGAGQLLDWFHAALEELPDWEASNLGRSVLALEGLCLFARGERFGSTGWMREVAARRHLLDGASAPAGASPADWAAKPPLGEDERNCVLWLVGEVPARLYPHGEALAKARFDTAAGERARVALLALLRIQQDERYGPHELARRLARGRAHLEWEDLPAPVRAALPSARWGSPRLRADGYHLSCRDAAMSKLEAVATAEGQVSLNERHV